MVRRAMALVSGLLLLNTTLGGTALACATMTHGSAAAAGPHSNHRMVLAHPALMHHSAPAPQRAPSRAPVDTNCCALVAPCAAVFACADAAENGLLPLSVAQVPVASSLRPVSAVTSPDPPPPKA
jgi:hypothetical protein